jgi:hypothetical protein
MAVSRRDARQDRGPPWHPEFMAQAYPSGTASAVSRPGPSQSNPVIAPYPPLTPHPHTLRRACSFVSCGGVQAGPRIGHPSPRGAPARAPHSDWGVRSLINNQSRPTSSVPLSQPPAAVRTAGGGGGGRGEARLAPWHAPPAPTALTGRSWLARDSERTTASVDRDCGLGGAGGDRLGTLNAIMIRPRLC